MVEQVLVLGISASPRNKATKFAIKNVLSGAKLIPDVKTELIDLRKMKIKNCLHCDKCSEGEYYSKTGYHCVQKDSMEEIYPKLLEAQGIVIGSPSYAGSISGLAKTFLDRFRPIWRHFHNKYIVGQGVAVGGSKHGGQDIVISQLHNIMNWWGIWIVPSGTWNSPHGLKIWFPSNNNLKGKSENDLSILENNEEIMNSCFKSGKRVALSSKIMRKAQDFEIKLPPLYK